ncbi:MAG: peroxidase family protein [Gammaproteobacteria bacterium]
MKRHIRDDYLVVGEGILTYDDKSQPVCHRPSTEAELRKFRFSRMGPKGQLVDEPLRKALAEAMTAAGRQPDSSAPTIPAGFTYLGQFIDHDLTLDKTGRSLGEKVTVAELVQGRSPALDLDSLYGRGPNHPEDAAFYRDAARLKMGTTAAVPFPDAGTNVDMNGFDLPRVGFGSKISERRVALIPDERNDENLAIAQVHLAFIRFHNRVVDKLAGEGTPSLDLFAKARRVVIRHYQWMIHHDFLPRILDKAIVDDVFTNGRKFFEVKPKPNELHQFLSWMWAQPKDTPTMPIEFSVAAYRLGHSMIRGAYQWNRVFRGGGPGGIATLQLLFRFSGTAGILSPPPADLNDKEAGDFERLPTNWIVDFRRLFDFGEAGRNDLKVPATEFNVTKLIDTLLVDPLKELPLGTFGGRGTMPPAQEFNLAFRNLTRANMVLLASGQQMAAHMGIAPLSAAQILNGNGGASLGGLTQAQKDALTANTPLWFYILREAELCGGRLTGVGGRIVAEVFHRAMEASATSIVREPYWRPYLGPDKNTFRMVDLLLFAFDGKAELLNPLGDAPRS